MRTSNILTVIILIVTTVGLLFGTIFYGMKANNLEKELAYYEEHCPVYNLIEFKLGYIKEYSEFEPNILPIASKLAYELNLPLNYENLEQSILDWYSCPIGSYIEGFYINAYVWLHAGYAIPRTLEDIPHSIIYSIVDWKGLLSSGTKQIFTSKELALHVVEDYE